MSSPAVSCSFTMQETESMYCSRKRESPRASLKARPWSTSVNHEGRGQERVTVVGRVRSRVALSIRSSSRRGGYTNSAVAYRRKGRSPQGAFCGPRCKGTVANGNIHRIGAGTLLRPPQERGILPPATARVNARVWDSRAAGAPRALVGPPLPGGPPRRLFVRLGGPARVGHYSRRPERAYLAWIRRFIFFHGKRLPAEMSAPEITKFLSSLAVEGNVVASTQNQALSALLFLYRDVLEQDLPWLDDVVRAKRPARLPVVLTRDEIRVPLPQIRGEARVTMLPAAGLPRHLEVMKRQHEEDIRRGAGWVELPSALARKYPNAGREWPWQWVFPATRMYVERA